MTETALDVQMLDERVQDAIEKMPRDRLEALTYTLISRYRDDVDSEHYQQFVEGLERYAAGQVQIELK